MANKHCEWHLGLKQARGRRPKGENTERCNNCKKRFVLPGGKGRATVTVLRGPRWPL